MKKTTARAVTFSEADLDKLLRYQAFRVRRAERERIAKYIDRLASGHDTSFVAWATRLYALAGRIRRQRIRR